MIYNFLITSRVQQNGKCVYKSITKTCLQLINYMKRYSVSGPTSKIQ